MGAAPSTGLPWDLITSHCALVDSIGGPSTFMHVGMALHMESRFAGLLRPGVKHSRMTLNRGREAQQSLSGSETKTESLEVDFPKDLTHESLITVSSH